VGGDAAYWGKHSPVLFPIVGSLKDNTYFYEEKAYQLGRHGFARDSIFEIETQTEDTVTFLLASMKIQKRYILLTLSLD
jgi:galactose mutarotase-like enzyme